MEQKIELYKADDLNFDIEKNIFIIYRNNSFLYGAKNRII